MKWFKYLLIFFVLYIYMYNPIFVFVRIGLMKVLLLFGVIYYLKNRKHLKVYVYNYRFIFALTILLALYVCAIVAINGGNAVTTPYILIIWILEVFFVPIWIVERILPQLKNVSFASTMICVGVVAASISVFLFLNPSITNFVLGSVIELPYENNYDSWERNFGIAEGLTNCYGVIQGVLGSLCLLLANKKKWYYYLFFILFTFSAIINARTGIIAVIITILYKFVFSSLRTKTVLLSISVLVYVSIMYLLNKYALDFLETIKYVSLFFTSTTDFLFRGEKSDYYASLDTFIQFPNSFFGWVFGEGITLFGATNRASSDIGYVNQIFTGGLVFLSGLLAIQFYIYRNLYKLRFNRFFILLLFFTALLINFKGIGFCTSESFSRFVMLLYVVLLHNKYYNNKIPLY